jgi:hypothetical protein
MSILDAAATAVNLVRGRFYPKGRKVAPAGGAKRGVRWFADKQTDDPGNSVAMDGDRESDIGDGYDQGDLDGDDDIEQGSSRSVCRGFESGSVAGADEAASPSALAARTTTKSRGL